MPAASCFTKLSPQSMLCPVFKGLPGLSRCCYEYAYISFSAGRVSTGSHQKYSRLCGMNYSLASSRHDHHRKESHWSERGSAVYKSRSGWMAVSALQPPKQTRFYPWLKLLFEQGKIANVFETCEGSACDGYLVARIGDQVEVLHYQCNAEGDWVYAHDAVYKSRPGWMPVSALQPPKQRRFYAWFKLLFEQRKIANVFERCCSLVSALAGKYN